MSEASRTVLHFIRHAAVVVPHNGGTVGGDIVEAHARYTVAGTDIVNRQVIDKDIRARLGRSHNSNASSVASVVAKSDVHGRPGIKLGYVESGHRRECAHILGVSHHTHRNCIVSRI